MAEGIVISTEQLIETAKKVRSINESLDDKLQVCNRTMQELEASWKSDAASDIRSAMAALKPRFENYKEIVESYAKFLDRTAQSYEQTESTVQTNAGQFK